MKNRWSIVVACVVLGAASLTVLAQEMTEVTVTAEPLGDGLYVIIGRGGNIGLSVGADGVFLIDDQYAPLTPAIMKAIDAITERPERFVLNTHYHGDHTGGNENLGKTGTIIVAHDNVRTRMSAPQVRDFLGELSESSAAPAQALPMLTFDNTVTFHLNGQTVRAFHVENAHTDGDTMIHFDEANVIHMGDVLFSDYYPYIDYMNGGSIIGTIAASDQALKIADDITKIIAGHGTPVVNAAQLRQYRDMLETVAVRIETMIGNGLTEEQVVEAAPTAEFDATWGNGFTGTGTWVAMVYRDLARGL